MAIYGLLISPIASYVFRFFRSNQLQQFPFQMFSGFSDLRNLQICLDDIQLLPRSLEKSLKEMRVAEDEVMKGQKGSRLSKWIGSSDSCREQAGGKAVEMLERLW